MTARDFCFWLQGHLEMKPDHDRAMSESQTEIMRRHLALVFKHEIDPPMGDARHQAELDGTHAGPPSSVTLPPPKTDPPRPTSPHDFHDGHRPHGVVRC